VLPGHSGGLRIRDRQAFDRIAVPNDSTFDDPTQHSTSAMEFTPKAGTNLLQLIARRTNRRYFEQRNTDAQALTRQKAIYIEAAGSDVFPDVARLEFDRIERFFIHQEQLTIAAAAAMTTSSETQIGDGLRRVQLFHGEPALATAKQVGDRRHRLVSR
jgi:hypothetical protein